MTTELTDLVKRHLRQLRQNGKVSDLVFRQGHALFVNGAVQLLSQTQSQFDFLVNDEFADVNVKLAVDYTNERVEKTASNRTLFWDAASVACLMQLVEELNRPEAGAKRSLVGKKYTREGMIKRVLAERAEKAEEAQYRIQFAGNVYGEHALTNEVGKTYRITFRDFKRQIGYCTCPDYQTNKLGTCKHLMFAFKHARVRRINTAKITDEYPFVEIYLDPLNDYKIACHFGPNTAREVKQLLAQYFNPEGIYVKDKLFDFIEFMRQASAHKQILVRPEVLAKVERAFNRREMDRLQTEQPLDFGLLKVEPFPYQKEGIAFATFREACIIGDEMGLGKTLQAIATAVLKRRLFGFKRTLVVCPASLKAQWQHEIHKFCHEQAVVVDGPQANREQLYQSAEAYFLIINYETMLRDVALINRLAPPDFVIADEAQRIKNFATLTAAAIKSLSRKHTLVITGTPIENRLTDLYSIVDFIDPYFLSPLWEFSYQHCYFDEKQRNKITGYYNLQTLHERLKPLLLRREKREVSTQLPALTELYVPVPMHPQQQIYHADYARGVASIVAKKFITPFDMQKLMLLLSKMRMVCDSTFLVDPETNISPKLDELRHILVDELDLVNTSRKIIIFSEWIKMNALIGRLLRELGIGFAELSSDVAVKNRDALVQNFATDPACKVFLSTEAGGSGLNLQMADTVINFELPWNPAKKNQRIGRIDRIGQQATHLTVINLVTRGSIEDKIATGLALKQSLFEGVMNATSQTDSVDFSAEGRAQFLQQMQALMTELLDDEDLPETALEPSPNPLDELLDFAQEAPEPAAQPEPAPPTEPSAPEPAPNVEEMEKVMTNGLGFISGLFKMMTGKDLPAADQKVEIDRQTGEVTLKFKLPV
ncbi:MAG: SNF2-related protein [Bernardetiaceae bacterium]|jgi:SNF2 family DNA or RNA helicase|nr:SNF2-related protein [Bernardetiaceae bacterium]